MGNEALACLLCPRLYQLLEGPLEVSGYQLWFRLTSIEAFMP